VPGNAEALQQAQDARRRPEVGRTFDLHGAEWWTVVCPKCHVPYYLQTEDLTRRFIKARIAEVDVFLTAADRKVPR